MIRVLTELKSKGVFLSLDASGENLSIKGKIGNLSEADKDGLRQQKKEIIDFLKSQEQSSQIIPVGLVSTDTLELAPNQKSIWVYEKIEGSSTAYSIPGIYSFSMPGLNDNRFFKSIQQLAEQNDVLRTIFIEEQDQPLQRILPAVNVIDHVQIIDVCGEADPAAAVRKKTDELFNQPFALSEKPLWEITLFRMPNDQYQFFLKVHHLIADGESLNLIIRRALQIYDVSEDTPIQHENSLQYKDYVYWINNKNNFTASSAFWTKELSGYEDDFRMPADFPDTGQRSFTGKEWHYIFDRLVTDKAYQFAKNHKFSIAAVLTGAATVVLSKRARKDDIVVGMPSVGRNQYQLWNTIGNFVNTLPLRIPVSYEGTKLDYLTRIQQKYHGALDHQLYPFSYILEDIGYQYKEDEFPLFNVMISIPNNQKIESFEERIKTNNKNSLYDITFTFLESKGEVQLITEYNAARFAEDTIRQITKEVELALQALADESQPSLQQLSLLPPGREQQIIAEQCRSTNPVKVQYASVVAMLRDQVVAYATETAAIFNDAVATVTYQQLWDNAQHLAAFMADKGVQKGDRVVVVLPKTISQTTAMWAAWMLGSVYVPVDTDYPQDRIDTIIADAAPALVIDREWIKTYMELEQPMPPRLTNDFPVESDLAYILYTSGSTGKPKGVVVSHGNLVNKMTEEIQALSINKDVVTVTITNLVFDVSLLETVLPLCAGGRVMIADESITTDISTLVAFIVQHGVTILQGTPTYFALFMEEIRRFYNKGINETVKHICIGGESLNKALADRFAEFLPGISLNNHYGPTEITIDAITNPGVKLFDSNIIGRPIGNTEAYVLDEQGNLLPDGVAGELVIGGPSVTQGYWNDPITTALKFRPVRYSSGNAYFTGDLAKRMPNGNIEFVGRKDKQVKIRGYRVELDEITNTVLQVGGIVNAHSGVYNNLLVCWVVSNGATEDDIIGYLTTKLPTYMLPTAIEFIEAMPMTVNGKVDAKRLPVPMKSRRVYAPPVTEVQKKIAAICEEVMSIPNIGINDNFFELGGHSLHMVRMANKINVTFQKQIRIKDLFTNHTVSLISELIEAKDPAERNRVIPKTSITGKYFPLSPSQYRLWISAQLGGNTAFNVPVLFNITGDFNLEYFRMVIAALIERHEALRTSFRFNEKKEICQYISDVEEMNFVVDYTPEILPDAEITRRINEIIASDFDLENGPLIKSGVYRSDKGVWAMYILIHHLVTDGWSSEIVLEEITKNYNSLMQTGRLHNYKPLDIQYKDYTVWLRENLERIFSNEESFWMKSFKKEIVHFRLPIEKTRPKKKTYNGNGVNLWSSLYLNERINEYVKKNNQTAFSFVLAVYKILLFRYTGLTDFTVGTPISGRINLQTENQIGLYLNTLPIRSEFSGSFTFKEVIDNENKVMKESHDNQLFQIDELLKRLDIKTPVGHSPLFNTMIIFQNQTSLGFTSVDNAKEMDVHIEPRDFNGLTSQFDIVIAFTETRDKLEINSAYNTIIYEHDHVKMLMIDLIYLLEKVLENPYQTLDDFFAKTEYEFLCDKPIEFKTPHFVEPEEEEVVVTESGELRGAGNVVVKQGLKDILNKYLEQAIEFDEDYFSRGGNSLGAIQAINDINEAFDVQFSILDFYNNSSINKLHDLIVGDTLDVAEVNAVPETSPLPATAALPQRDLLVRLTPADNNLPDMYMIPPILGSGIIFKPLADQVKDHFTVYGIDVPVLNQEPDIIGAVSQQIFDAILANKKDDVVFLLGYSIGVNMAYEVTKLLEARGKTVVLFLMDRGPETNGNAGMNEELIKDIIEQHRPLIEMLAVKGEEPLFEARIRQVLTGMDQYSVAGKVNASICAFECQDNPLHDYMQNWAAFTNGAIEVQLLPGGHYEALRPDNVTMISQKIKNIYHERSSVH
jgi:amino acid adenylation domain-containing protein